MNKGKRWTKEENKLLITELLNTKSLEETAKKIERSTYAITKQLEKILLNNNINIIDEYNNLLINTVNKISKTINYENDIKKEILSKNNNTEIKLILDEIIETIDETNHLNELQLKCYNLAKSNNNILITGSGGSGKSTVLKTIIKYYKKIGKNIGVTSSTGVSASLINGVTLHSFLKIGLGTKTYKELYEKLKFKSNKSDYNKLKKLEVLIIDEISMIDDKLFNKIAAYLSLIKEIKKPFGGIQIILCGDFYQLPPVNNTYCFNSNIWDRLKIKVIELKEKMRQINDLKFQNILDNVKINNITDEIYNELKLLKKNKLNSDIKPTIMYSKNVDVDIINNNEFNKLVKLTNNQVYEFPLRYDVTNYKISKHVNNLKELHNLKLCKGLQVMLTYNIDIINKLTNGTRCIIEEINYPEVTIKTLDNKKYNINYISYINENDHNIEYQFMPIKLAYAITIHKSQGQTLDYIEIDLGNDVFEYGMAYVALSRARSLSSIYLKKISRNAFKIDKQVIKFYNNLS